MNTPKAVIELVRDPQLAKEQKMVLEKDVIELQALEKTGLQLLPGKYSSIEVSDCNLEKLVANNVSTFRSTFVRVMMSSSQLTGLQVPEGNFKDVIFRDCRLNLANFRRSTFERCLFLDCDLTEADFAMSEFKNVRFESCQLQETEFSNCKNNRLEFEESSLADVKGVTGLKNAQISNQNLVEIAALLAHEMQIIVKD